MNEYEADQIISKVRTYKNNVANKTDFLEEAKRVLQVAKRSQGDPEALKGQFNITGVSGCIEATDDRWGKPSIKDVPSDVMFKSDFIEQYIKYVESLIESADSELTYSKDQLNKWTLGLEGRE